MANLLRRPNDRTDASLARRQAVCVEPLVLVVEDHDDTRFMLKYLLESRGCRVALAEDGEAAVRVAEQTHPDLILMDAGLPRMDGLAATRRIRKTPALACVPVVFLSGHAEAPFRAAALETGCDDYLIKPFEIDQLERVLERHLGGAPLIKAK
jgi:two-component system, cell cycle response regulator DivK